MTTHLSEFDAYARDYLNHLDHPLRRIVSPNGANYFIQLKCAQIQRLLNECGLRARDLIAADIGCGIGLFEVEMRGWFKRLLAFDLSQEMLKVSRHLDTAEQPAHYACADALALPLAANSVDVVFSSCLYHHMPHAGLEAGLREMRRVCRPGGFVIIFEHNPYNPLTQLVVKTTPLDRNARLLTDGQVLRGFARVGLQIIANRFFLYGPQSVDVYLERVALLERLPFGGQYAVIGQKV